MSGAFVCSVIACYEKAVFLLKFAGLSRVTHDGGEEGKEEVNGSPAPHSSWPGQSSSKWQKISNAISTVGRLKQQVPWLTCLLSYYYLSLVHH